MMIRPTSTTASGLMKITDDELFSKAKFFGGKVLYYRQKFIGLLPEVNRRKLYERKNFGSIFEFAFKLAGHSEQQVRRALNLEERFKDLPVLNGLLVGGEVSINKLARVASIATSENEGELATLVQVLSQGALETLVRDGESLEQNGLSKPQNEGKTVRAHKLELSEEVSGRLLELQGKGIDVNGLLLEFLDRREREIADEKEAIREDLEETASRYVVARTKKVLNKEHGTKCSIKPCKRPATELHHTQTFALSKMHDPHFLAHLCKEHHQIAHSINLNFQAKRRRAVL